MAILSNQENDTLCEQFLLFPNFAPQKRNIALDIKATIKADNLASKEVAERMGITTVGLSQHVNDNPSVEFLYRIANAIGCGVSELSEKPETNDCITQLRCPYCHRQITLHFDDKGFHSKNIG